uniref:Uncharacterized protein n=1 Tax=Aegilops tauschii TaxID=37682 RepID=R7W781_AEGTA
MATDAQHQRHSRNGGVHTGHHFLIVAYGIQSHLNPCRVLAHRLARLHGVDGSGAVLATVSLPVSAHRRTFPSSGDVDNDDKATDGVVSYAPYSDGLDDGSMARDGEARARSRQATFESLSAVVATLAARGRPQVKLYGIANSHLDKFSYVTSKF